MNLDFSSKTVIVSGASQGIGQAIAQSLKSIGARVICLDRDFDGLKKYIDGELSHPLFDCYTLDLSDRKKVKELIDFLYDKYGAVNGFVNAAGGVCGQVGQPIENIDADSWNDIFNANLYTGLWVIQALAPKMKISGTGSIVTISSGAGLRPSLTGIQAYTSSKHALIGLTKQLAQELGPYGIWVNCIAPGFVLSNPSTQKQWDKLGTEKQDIMIKNINMQRLGTGQDIANAALFLLSDYANWISGQVLSVDGGHR